MGVHNKAYATVGRENAGEFLVYYLKQASVWDGMRLRRRITGR